MVSDAHGCTAVQEAGAALREASLQRARKERKAMRTITLAAVLALLAGPAVAQQQTYRNERGQITGSSLTSGNVTTFRDRSGRMTGTAERMRDGSVQYRDAMGRLTGSATAPRR
jgi:YD repeat-containing protein